MGLRPSLLLLILHRKWLCASRKKILCTNFLFPFTTEILAHLHVFPEKKTGGKKWEIVLSFARPTFPHRLEIFLTNYTRSGNGRRGSIYLKKRQKHFYFKSPDEIFHEKRWKWRVTKNHFSLFSAQKLKPETPICQRLQGIWLYACKTFFPHLPTKLRLRKEKNIPLG